MNKIFKIISLTTFIFTVFINYSYSATGAADIYKVTMRKIEFCTASTGVTSCDNAVVVGTGDKVVDIASVTAGSSAASYGTPALLPLGETYTHIRVTIDRKFSVRSETAITGGDANTDACVTIATADSQYATDEATDKYTHKPAVAEGGTRAEMNLYLINDKYTRCNNAACSNATDDQTMTYAQGTGSSAAQTQHADGSSDADHILIYKLTTPYKVTTKPPIVDISFGTQNAIGVNNNGSNLCQIWAEEPIVTVTIK